jgi:prolyl oligopeptidase
MNRNSNLRSYTMPLFYILLLTTISWSLMPSSLFAQKASKKTDLDLLVSWMQGTYNSYEQSLADTNYLNITLDMRPIWQERTDGKWLYVEQAVANMTYQPYRQRIYQVVAKGKNTFESRVYTLPQPARFVGQWNNQTLFAQINPDSLILRDGCAIILKKTGNTFTGQTNEKSCPSDLRGAAYATSKVTISEHQLLSWDQGFDKAGKQVWGATTGPYQFNKLPKQTPMQYPNAQQGNQTDNYFGTIVPDPYRWLEDENSPETQQWIAQQNNLTQNYLQSTGYQKPLADQLTQYFNYPKYSAPRKQGDYYYFYKNDGLQNHSILYRQKGLNGTPEVFLDPNTFSKDGSIALTTTSFSKDKKYMVYGTSVGGSDWQTFQLLEVSSGKVLPDTLQNIKFSGASWYKNGFFYTRFDKPDEGKELSAKNEAARVYYHKIGTPQADDFLVFENKTNPRLSFGASVSSDEQFILMYISEGSASGNALYYAQAEKWQSGFYPIINQYDHSFSFIDNLNDKLLVKTNYKAPNYRLVLIDPRKPEEQYWKTILAEQPDAVLDNVNLANGNLLVEYMKDVTSQLKVFSVAGVLLQEIPLPGLGVAGGFSADKDEPLCYFSFESFLYPPTIFKHDLTTNKSEVYYQPKIDFNFSDYETKQVFYPSKDGTKIPMFITHRKGIPLNGQHPCLLYSYGGFNISRIPEFKAENLPFYLSGGIYAVANLRGGSEYGEEWHKAGMLEKKQNVFDDYIAAAEYLIKEKYTRPEKLAATGRSNGGLLIGAVMNQRPELFAVALPVVGVMDMLRFHKFTIGWAWVSEYGSSDNAEQFKFLYPYSPYHNLKPNLPYPATMVMTAQRDDRVVPAHSYKYTARLQQQYKGNQPQLIRIESMSGHGGGGQGKTIQQFIDTYTDVWSFVFKHLSMYPVSLD